MIESADSPGFLLKPPDAFRIVRRISGQYFHGDIALQTRIVRAINFAHASCSYGRDDLVGTKTSGRRNRHYSFVEQFERQSGIALH